MTKRELIAKNREAILALAAKHGATDVRLFGSVARGDEDEKSDVDVLVKMLPGSHAFALVDLQLALEALLGCKVDVFTEHKDMRPHFREEVTRDAIAV
jgi:predicted nucleotidyltransferase